jgi:glycosyltransferase involved in cell wall biosynthesis
MTAVRGMLAGGLHPQEVGDAVRRMSAEVVHAHNLHPMLGWRALAAAQAAGARTVLHLHNFRLFCAIAVAYRDGAPCFRCRGRNTLPGLRLRCRGSLSEAAVYAAALCRQHPRLIGQADRLIALSEATEARLRQLGLPAAKTTVLPNFVRADALAEDSRADGGTFALAVGRLVEEKGFDTAIAAARAAGVPLVIAGGGPDEARLRSLADDSVTFAGHVTSDVLADLRSRAAVALAPSRCEEQCPYTALDAMSAGVPVLASNRGGLPEVVGQDATLPPDDPAAWSDALQTLWRDPERRLAQGRGALARARAQFGEDRYYQRLLAIYEDRR